MRADARLTARPSTMRGRRWRERHPGLRPHRPYVRAARNGAYAGWDDTLTEGDVIAFLPPVSGGATTALVDGPIDVAEPGAGGGDDRPGAVVTFIGRARDRADDDRAVIELEYEVYPEMAAVGACRDRRRGGGALGRGGCGRPPPRAWCRSARRPSRSSPRRSIAPRPTRRIGSSSRRSRSGCRSGSASASPMAASGSARAPDQPRRGGAVQPQPALGLGRRAKAHAGRDRGGAASCAAIVRRRRTMRA